MRHGSVVIAPCRRTRGCLLARFCGLMVACEAFELADGVAVGFELVGVVHEPVERGICKGRIIKGGVPGADLELAGDDGGSSVIAIVEDFQQVAFELVGEIGDGQVIEQQDICVG